MEPSPLAKLYRSVRTAFWPALIQSFSNEVLDNAKAAAYSGMLMLFPAFLVATTLLALIPAGNNLLNELRGASEQVLPADTMSLLLDYFQTQRAFSLQVILSASSLSFVAAWGVMSTLMDGFRHAYRLPPVGSQGGWSFWQQRLRAVLLVPIALVPLTIATCVVIFGQPIEHWMVQSSDHELRFIVLVLWRLARWGLAVVTCASVLGAVYHYGTHSRESWTCIAPGAITATCLWFPVTLAFGAYVTKVADYTVIYGSLGTAIATLVWLYISSYSVLLGAQLNGVLHRNRRKQAIHLHATSHPAPIESTLPDPPM
jgi:membrane protein